VRVPLTPLDFLERARRLFGALGAVVDGDLPELPKRGPGKIQKVRLREEHP
jgi:hypothetical protein